MELFEDVSLNLEDVRPTHVYDLLDSNIEQQNCDDEIIGDEEDPDYAGRNPDILINSEKNT